MESERIQLLRTIAENPGDDRPRLIMADWLEENGEPEHAELIRVQCELAKYPQYVEWLRQMPLSQWRGGRDEHELMCRLDPLIRRERELLKAMPWSDACEYSTMDRGFIVSTVLESEEMRIAVLLSRGHPLHTIRLTDWQGIERSLPPKPREALPFLKRLELSEYAYTNAGFDELSRHLPGVTISYYNMWIS
jgi:uncharacterized protein (TIGR02996 family)